jgi:hypothetical protein
MCNTADAQCFESQRVLRPHGDRIESRSAFVAGVTQAVVHCRHRVCWFAGQSVSQKKDNAGMAIIPFTAVT